MPPAVLECPGVYVGNFGKTLIFAAETLQNTARKFTDWARKLDFGLADFMKSILSTTRDICLPFNGMIMGRASNPQDGFTFRERVVTAIAKDLPTNDAVFVLPKEGTKRSRLIRCKSQQARNVPDCVLPLPIYLQILICRRLKYENAA
jgi:hypothetical protein